MNQPFSTIAPESVRQRFVTGLLTLTHGTRLAPTLEEQALLAQFVRGEITLEQVLAQLESSANDPS
ncbi:hypothetical protein [Hymenobacter sp. YC55]|uniref:hypothetical protein n=1 Tax=Hymenobacter sp. YC55 TaxID=3034019 RepID=UPI0023F6625F|nr:hypothetical protein [Hymenobacter sp. YC55]MDF7814760.1 hypothetical protein [Hymenobacter sp. YC55]